jgi:hypothetical protein
LEPKFIANVLNGKAFMKEMESAKAREASVSLERKGKSYTW